MTERSYTQIRPYIMWIIPPTGKHKIIDKASGTRTISGNMKEYYFNVC